MKNFRQKLDDLLYDAGLIILASIAIIILWFLIEEHEIGKQEMYKHYYQKSKSAKNQ